MQSNLPTELKEKIETAARTQSDKYKREMIRFSTDLDCVNESGESYYQGYKDGAEDFGKEPSPSDSELVQALELAEVELKAMYKRLGFKGSNVLDTVTAALKNHSI